MFSSPACEGKPRLRFLQSLAKKAHTKESVVPLMPPPHTSKVGGASDCNVIANVMSQDDKDWIVWNHNQKRIQVAIGDQPGQPGASNMYALVIIKDISSIYIDIFPLQNHYKLFVFRFTDLG